MGWKARRNHCCIRFHIILIFSIAKTRHTNSMLYSRILLLSQILKQKSWWTKTISKFMHPTIFTKKLQADHIAKAVPMSRSQASLFSLNFNDIQVAISQKKINKWTKDSIVLSAIIKIQGGIYLRMASKYISRKYTREMYRNVNRQWT